MVMRLEFKCTNNQAEYEALAIGLEALLDMKARNVEACGDSQLEVKQVLGESWCLDRTLNQYLKRCKQLIGRLDTFRIRHVSRNKNEVVNRLAQQASRYMVTRGKFSVLERLISCSTLNANESAMTGISNAAAEDWRTAIQKCITDLGA
jgi:ribonuclease HI